MDTVIRQTAVAIALVAMAGCGVHKTEVPAVSGPSAFASNVTVNAIPDAISQDGGSQSSVKVLVTGPDGKGVSGVPMVLNTSFNENEPVVCRPEEALDCFLRTRMDVLVLGHHFIERKN